MWLLAKLSDESCVLGVGFLSLPAKLSDATCVLCVRVCVVAGKAIRCIVCVGCEDFVWLPVKLSDASCVLGVRILCGYWLSYQVHPVC